jgi:hemoglobin
MHDIKNRKDIILLVDTFYAKVLKDERINYFFTEVAKLDFEKHMPRMYDFWESTLLHTASYKGNTLKVHKDLNEKSPLQKEHFDTWIMLFKQTVDELFLGNTAELAKQRATSIAMIMELKMNPKNKGLL